MNIIKTLPLSIVILAILAINTPVAAVINANAIVYSATGEIVDISPLLSVNEQVITPHSGFQKPADVGLKAHTNFKFMIPPGGLNSLNTKINISPLTAIGKPPYAGYGYNTPASLACAYSLVTPVAGCVPDALTVHANGGSKAIAVVVAYHYTYAKVDLTSFSAQFGLPVPTAANFQVVYASGYAPPTDPYGWEIEAALDLQWAHAMAPNAKLILVEAASNSYTNLNAAVVKASALVAAAGGGEVSMSYGGSEWAGETAFEATYKTPKVVYFAASGDTAGTSYPCVSPNVVCVGGTALRRNPATKALLQEVAWIDGGSGISPYFKRPVYQNAIAAIIGTQRGVPDVSLVADPHTSGWVKYTPSDDADDGGWWLIGGTSWSSPTFAGIVNSAAHFYLSSAAELTTIYAAGLGTTSTSMFRNISAGYCGLYIGWTATFTPKWDICTGVGSNLGKVGK